MKTNVDLNPKVMKVSAKVAASSKKQIRQLQNKVKTLKGHLSKRRSEHRNQRRRGKNMDYIHAHTSTLVEKGLSKALQCTYKKY